jgi:hypothetical protein
MAQALCSLSVASYDSQGYGGGVLSRLHTGFNDSVSILNYIAYNDIVTFSRC